MNVNTVKMEDYAAFLADNSTQIKNLCASLQDKLAIATQCMDQDSGRAAAQRMSASIERLAANVPISDDASQRLIKSKKYIDSAHGIFGR